MSKYGSHTRTFAEALGSRASHPGRSLTAGAIVVLSVGQLAVAATPKTAPAKFTPTPILSTAQAQKQVHFHISVPRTIPAGFRLVGARVSSPGPAKSAAAKGVQTIKGFGYGIVMTVPPGSHSVVVFAVPGSAGAKAGIPSTPGRLLALNGHSVQDDPDTLVKLNDELNKAKPPITITFKDSSNNSHIAVVSQKSTFIFKVPGQTAPSAEPSAALLYSSKKGSFAIVESKVNPDQKLYYVGQPWKEQVGNIQIIFYVSKQAPNATFVINGIKYDVAQANGYITEDQIKQLAASM